MPKILGRAAGTDCAPKQPPNSAREIGPSGADRLRHRLGSPRRLEPHHVSVEKSPREKCLGVRIAGNDTDEFATPTPAATLRCQAAARTGATVTTTPTAPGALSRNLTVAQSRSVRHTALGGTKSGCDDRWSRSPRLRRRAGRRERQTNARPFRMSVGRPLIFVPERTGSTPIRSVLQGRGLDNRLKLAEDVAEILR
jgi:hypothetical protein